MSEVIIRGGTIVTMDSEWHVHEGDVASRDGELVHVGGPYTPIDGDYEVLDATGCVVLPGFVQSHVHLCQALARGRADDLELLDWLEKIVWPYEGALTRDDASAAARIACVELLRGGTTAVLDMATVHHTDAIFEAARDTGLRATIGKAMMDAPHDAIPAGLRETTNASLDESAALCERWHNAANGRLRYAYAPRFALSCTDELLREVATRARAAGARIHTHASENRDEIAEVKRRTGKDNILYLHDVGLTGPDVGLAHCVWLDDNERAVLRESGTHVLHCPSSNLKLGSGIATIPELLDSEIAVSLGADGAPCNNNLDAFMEMRLAALIQKPRCGATAMRAPLVVRMATMGGARALGLEDSIGSLEIGKRADVVAVDVRTAHAAPSIDPYSTIVYSSRASDVRHVVVDGAIVVRDQSMLTADERDVVDAARKAAAGVFGRI